MVSVQGFGFNSNSIFSRRKIRYLEMDFGGFYAGIHIDPCFVRRIFYRNKEYSQSIVVGVELQTVTFQHAYSAGACQEVDFPAASILEQFGQGRLLGNFYLFLI